MAPTSLSATATSLSWIPSEAVTGAARRAFDVGFAHYDAPPPDVIDDLDELRAADGFRFANVLSVRAGIVDGQVSEAGYADGSGVVMGSTTVRLGRLGATFAAVALPVIQREPEYRDDGTVRLVQTCGGRTALPMPRQVPHAPFVKMQAPWVWTTLALVLRPDGTAEVELAGASPFPRHWVYDATGALALKSGLTNYAGWVAHSFGARTPWGDEDSPALVTASESASERVLSRMLMTGAKKPKVISLAAGDTLTKQGMPGDELYLLLDGVLAVDVDGARLAELGPGAVLGERAVLEGGRRTSTLTAVTQARVAVAPAEAIDRDRLAELASSHRREEQTPEAELA
ncbi:cyclic nucleotide-binding domain-containing protein [Phytoactinopolyspora mesophila]|uniref:Cyclic nucleotide-binding domain-containing protein n=1 Tax=Phytoactinopolyspora mesophila TaxID=2650750 RepID=A0A7K3M0I2_9ACTN|nr:cyclic nucleotide-binding domain-containing protein [Phytoactinopolyspora mesophila]NDL56760.1 cyclic nucleotide-binding domain-containing protein [Phytoactinopolyspora mesophila]